MPISIDWVNVSMVGTQLPDDPCHAIIIQAGYSNTGQVQLDSEDGSYPIILDAGQSMTISAISNANEVWARCTVADEGLGYIAMQYERR